MTAVSILFASRKRPKSLASALLSLCYNAADPEGIQVIVALDPDDEETLEALAAGGVLGSLDFPSSWTFCVAPTRFGYVRLHEYLNYLAKIADSRSQWLMWFNDDMRMLTNGWDAQIEGHRPAILWPTANHAAHANIAPIWPRSWTEATGRVSPVQHMDTYLQRLGESLGRHDKVDIEIFHDRPDITGISEDETYAEGRKLLGSEGMVPGFDAAEMLKEVATDAAVIRRLGLLWVS